MLNTKTIYVIIGIVGVGIIIAAAAAAASSGVSDPEDMLQAPVESETIEPTDDSEPVSNLVPDIAPSPSPPSSPPSSPPPSDPTPLPTATVDIGVLLPSIGDVFSDSQDNSIAIQLGVTDFNRYLEDNDVPWRFNTVLLDTQLDPHAALEKIQLLNARNIKFVLGPESSAEIRNIKSYVDTNDMILISPSSTTPALAIEDNIFRLVPDDTQQGSVLAMLFEQKGIKAVIPVYRADVRGDGLYESTKTNFEALGGIMDEGIRYPPEASIYSTEASALSNLVNKYSKEYTADEIGVLVIGSSETVHLLNFVDEYEDLHNVRWFGSEGTSNDNSLINDPVASGFMQDVDFTSTQFATSKNNMYDRVNEYFLEFKGTTPNTYAFSAYDSVWILGKAILETRSTEPAFIRDELSRVVASHTGALGAINLNKAGDVEVADYELWGIIDGTWHIVGHFNSADGTFDFRS